MKIYRGQQVSIVELETLKNAEGGLIVMNSFVSATKRHEVAVKFARKFTGQAGLKPVIFEIGIDKYDGEQDQQPFADITGEAFYGEREAEILIGMRAVMLIESVKIQEPIAQIHLRLYRYGEMIGQNCDTDLPLLKYDFSNLIDNQMASLKMLLSLMCIGEYHKAEQMLYIIRCSEDSPSSTILDSLTTSLDIARVNTTQSNACDRIEGLLNQHRESFQAILDLELVAGIERVGVMKVLEVINHLLHLVLPENGDFSSCFLIFRQLNNWSEMCRKYVADHNGDLTDSSLNDILRSFSVDSFTEKASKSEHISTAELEHFTFDKDPSLPESNVYCIVHLWFRAYTATKDGEYDQAIELIQNGLAIPCTNDFHILLYNQLANIYEKQENWTAAIETYQQIIKMPQLAPNSSAIIKAHGGCGDVYSKIKEFSQAFNCYTKALDLQLQHYPHDHLETSNTYIHIGYCYKNLGDVKSALDYYQKAILMGHPETMSGAYRSIALIYLTRKEYDSARSNLIKSLELAKTLTPQITSELIFAYKLLITVEHQTKNHYQRDVYIDQLMKITDSRDYMQSLISSVIEEVLHFVNTTKK